MREHKTARTYTITELCERFDVTPRTLRYYEEIGLLTPQRRGTHRIYNERDRVRLQLNPPRAAAGVQPRGDPRNPRAL
ncbi:MerR family DNA-binding transcriptional regulator [Marinithermus hydrothermalis]|uniref:MerR family DNA-binding transcriptional regulator n=1 Tax=Marinithermus hydrothermalis TaxID=186192 RepID=UPI0003062B5B|nr:MerR family DNA-binding transcriptional regulator [Marinithermus hydrothermalis]